MYSLTPESLHRAGLHDIPKNISEISGIEWGTATVTAYNTFVVVTHSLGAAPRIFLEPQEITGILHFISNKTALDFQINLAAPQESDTNFDYFLVKA